MPDLPVQNVTEQRAYDAANRWLAAEGKTPSATFDEKLATFAQTGLACLN